MVKKRWGKEFIDQRDHKKYQEELIKRHEIYLDLDWVESWNEELIRMNQKKRGKPYEYPNSMIQWQSLLVEKFTTRGAEAITRKLEEKNLVPKTNDHATIHRRILKLNLKFEIPKGVMIHEGSDGSGFKMSNAGEYFQNTYGTERRKYAKVVITASKGEILDVTARVNEKNEVSEPDISQEHIKNIIEQGGEIEKSYNDGAFDKRKFFNFLEEHNIESAIRIRKDASTKTRNSLRRKREVKEFKEKGYKNWAKDKNYGMRWVMTEGHFSAIKRCYGECSRAKKRENALTELKRKVWIYDKVRKYGRNKTINAKIE